MTNVDGGATESSRRVDPVYSKALMAAFKGDKRAIAAFPQVIQAAAMPIIEGFEKAESLEDKAAAASALSDKTQIKEVLRQAGYTDEAAVDRVIESMSASPRVPVDSNDDTRIGQHEVTDLPAEGQREEEDIDSMELARELQEINNDYADIPNDEEVPEALQVRSKNVMQKVRRNLGRVMLSTAKVGGILIGIFIAIQFLFLAIHGGKGK